MLSTSNRQPITLQQLEYRFASLPQDMLQPAISIFQNVQNWVSDKIKSSKSAKIKDTFRYLTGLRALSGYTLLANHSGIKYYLLDDVSFNSAQETYFLAHGWCSAGAKDRDFQDLLAAVKAYAPNANVIFIDWREYSNSLNYFSIRKNALKVGKWVSDFLIDLDIDPSTTTLMGYSTGAHVLGNAGAKYSQETGTLIDTIIAMEPAGPLFEGISEDQRLDNGDAVHVVALHSTNILGFSQALGDIDIYLNDWANNIQPGSNSLIPWPSSHAYPLFLLTDLFQGKIFQQYDQSLFSLDYLYSGSGSCAIATH